MKCGRPGGKMFTLYDYEDVLMLVLSVSET